MAVFWRLPAANRCDKPALACAIRWGSLRAAIEWFCNATVAEFENRTVKELIASGEIDPVLMYLSSGSAGSSG